jgi:hypothetical protein
MKTLTTRPRWSYSAQTKRYQNIGTKNLLKRVYTSLYRFRVRFFRGKMADFYKEANGREEAYVL